MRWAAIAAVCFVVSADAPCAQDAACGPQTFAPCTACHATTPTAGQRPGPNLAGLVGRGVAGDPAFDYSPALREARAKGELWTRETLDVFLTDPEAVYPGQWMGGPPLRDAKTRAAILCFLGAR